MSINSIEERLDSAALLISRLERLSADSYWAHQASGLRGSLLKFMEQFEAGKIQGRGVNLDEKELSHLDDLLKKADDILLKAAREIRTPDSQDKSGNKLLAQAG